MVFLVPILCVALAASLALGASQRFYLVQARAGALHAIQQQQATLRLLRLATGDQRNVALTLLGHAQAEAGADPGALTCLARRLLDLSEDLLAETETPDAKRFLALEDLALQPLIAFALEQVASHLGPGRRAWRIDPAFAQTRLRADRRALNQVLVNVLSGAAAATQDGDWIELSVQQDAAGLAITVQDEGVGLPIGPSEAHREESRGIGLRLTLARTLMQAHGGALTVESAERVGTRVRLGFPAGQVGL